MRRGTARRSDSGRWCYGFVRSARRSHDRSDSPCACAASDLEGICRVIVTGAPPLSGALMADDFEAFLLRWRLEVRGHGIEIRIRGPRRVRRQVPAAMFELTLAEVVRRVYEVQLMLDTGALE